MSLLTVFLLGIILRDATPAGAQQSGMLHVEGSQLVNAAGNPVILTGINWFGLETESFAPHGLWARNWEDMLDQVRDLGFNTIRLPYSNALFEPSSIPNTVNYELNPDLEGLSGLEIMDKIVEGAGERGIRIMLDRHRPGASAQSELWYTAEYSEERWIADWVMLAERYAGDETVIGADLHNEPHGAATWGTGDPTTDWRLAAERAGNAILEANPDWLIIVQGIEQYEGDWYWWGGNLLGAREYPVRLNVPNRLVYSTHVYGPGVYPQPWFEEANFPDNLPQIWDDHWGYLVREEIAPVIVGEFGGRSVGEDKEGIWQRALVSYLREHSLSYFYWTLNPNSGDTGGLLLDDWESVDPAKQELLSSYQFPPIGEEGDIVGQSATPVADATPAGTATAQAPSTEAPTAVPPTAPAVSPDALQVRFRMPHAAAGGQDAKPEFIITNQGPDPVALANVELFYWLDDENSDSLVFHCDWAAVGCSNVMGDFGSAADGARYLRISFGAGAGSIDSGADSGEIKIRFNRTDWSPIAQEAHYSFSPIEEYETWDRVTLEVDGNLVWGVAPGGAAVAAAATVESTTEATVMDEPPTPTQSVATAYALEIATATPEAYGSSVASVVVTLPPGATVSSRSGLTATGLIVVAAATVGGIVALLALGVAIGMYLTRRDKGM